MGGKQVDDPGSYLELFGRRSVGEPRLREADWIPITFQAIRPSPWTGEELLSFSPSAGVIQRGSEFVRLPKELSATISARRSLAAPAADGGFDWPLVSGSLGAVLALALITLLLVRRRRPVLT